MLVAVPLFETEPLSVDVKTFHLNLQLSNLKQVLSTDAQMGRLREHYLCIAVYQSFLVHFPCLQFLKLFSRSLCAMSQ